MLMKEVGDGKFPIGSMLPTELELCERFDVSRYTIREALRRLEEIGLEAQWLLFEGLRTLGMDAAPVLEAEAVQRDPALAMTRLWTSLALEYKAEAFSWNEASTPEDWAYVQGWHESVSGSTGIRQAAGESPDAVHAEFARYVKRAPQLQSYLDHHRPYYEKLRAHSIT